MILQLQSTGQVYNTWGCRVLAGKFDYHILSGIIRQYNTCCRWEPRTRYSTLFENLS